MAKAKGFASFGGKPKTANKPPNKTAIKALGGMPPRKKAQDIQTTMDSSLGNKETGFIQNTPKKATAAMMGRPPPLIGGLSKGPRADAKKQFKPKGGKKVF